MSIESEIFLKHSPDSEKLKEYEFIQKSKLYIYEKEFIVGFLAKISVSLKGGISGIVYDVENNDEYLPLRIENQEGAFVGKVREAYIKLLTDIREKCFCENFFVSAQGNRIAKLIREQYDDKPLFLWEDSPTTGVFKNPKSGKWYGIIMYIPRTKISERTDDWVEVINLKLDKDEIQKLLKKEGFYPAYHMNKKMWITITLDETLKDDEIMNYVEKSYLYTVKKTKTIVL